MVRTVVIFTLLSLFSVIGYTQEQVIVPPDFELSSPGEEPNGAFGEAVAGIRDINNDGYPDIVTGAPLETPESGPDGAGCVYVWCGKTGDLVRILVSPNQEENGHFGYFVAEADDVNNDNIPDILIGAPHEDPGASPDNAGRAYVFDGQTGIIIYTLVSSNEEENGYFGCSGASIPINFNGDMVIGAYGESPGSSPDGAGRAYIVDGTDGSVSHTLVSPNEETDGKFGFSVSASYGGFSAQEVIVGAYGESPDTSPDEAGRAYVFSAITGALNRTFQSPNEEEGGRFGYVVLGIHDFDLDEDQHGDFVIGAPWENPISTPDDAGAAYVFSGNMGTLLRTLTSPNEEENGHFSFSLGYLGDLSMDGHGDLILGAPDENGIYSDMGHAYIFSVWNDLFYVLESTNPEPSGHFGSCVSGAQEYTWSPHQAVVGAPGENPDISPVDAGRAYSYSFPYIFLSGMVESGSLTLDWTPCPNSSTYDIYGAPNDTYFEPGLEPPLEYLLDTISGGSTVWSTTHGIGNPDQNYTFIVVGRSFYDDVTGISNRFGEHEYGMDIP